jgi:4-hydroxy-3-methylbut-2-enyl diphosphate reductase
MGQYDYVNGGHIYLVEDEEDVAALVVNNPDKLSYVTQTTLSMDDTARVIDALREKFPEITGPRKNDICYATQNRQDAVKTLAESCDLMLVVGSPNSSNSNRLRELGERMGAAAYLIDNASEIKPEWLEGKQSVGITAGASAPEVLVKEVVDKLIALGGSSPQELQGQEENVVFSLPKELKMVNLD